jgi:DNA-binding GntR family transcriptional regulator
MGDSSKEKTKNSAHKKGVMIEDACQKIKELMYAKQLAPGQKLIYGDLAQRLGISITPIIQALNRLETLSLVNYVPNKGYFVGVMTEAEARKLYEAREALEVYIIPEVVRNLNPSKLTDIKGTWKQYGQAKNGDDRHRLVFLDAQFHLKIAECAGNEIIYGFLKQIYEQIYLKCRPEYLGDERINEVISEHRSLIKALGTGNMEETIAITKQHIKAGLAQVIKSLQLSQSSVYRGKTH